jgi:hypothetical protein
MMERLRDESGVALPLAIMVMVLIGVMGAGLLVFVRNDLEAVVEVNQGQKAFEIADAGIQAAKTQQLSDVVRRHYDRDRTNDCDNGQLRATAQDWSPNTTIYSDPRNCSSSTITRPVGGITKDFAGGRFNVTIECFAQGDTSCVGGEAAPEAIEASKRAFFKITSTGYYPADGSGAKRKIEAIFYTNRLDVPTAYYTPNDIAFNGSPDVAGVSFFSGGNIQVGNADIDRTTPALYRDWDTTNPANFSPTSNLNTVPRRTGPNITDPRVETAGFGAEGLICKNACSDPSDSIADGINDYDSTTATKGSQKRFVRKSDSDIASNVANASGTISYPFNPNAKFDLTLLESIAREQGNYHEGNIDIVDTTSTLTNKKYPNPSSDQTVFYVKANGATIDYFANYSPQSKGLIVIENGNFEISNSSNGFDGVVLITGDGVSTGLYNNTGNETVKGFVVAEGKMTIGGSVDPFSVIGDYTQRPGFFDVKLWSWRECYNAACN